MSATEIEDLLNALDLAESKRPSSRRKRSRYPFRLESCTVSLQQPGASSLMDYTVHTRNLSDRGLSFLHGGFVHQGTFCKISLTTNKGSCILVDGKVVNCVYREHGVHEVSVCFDDEIQTSDFCMAALKYNILLVEDDDAIARLATHHLGMLNVDVDRAKNGEEGIKMAKDGLYDCILMDVEMPVMSGLDATRQLRSDEYTGRIIAVTAKTQPEDRKECLDAGCDGYLAKPAQPEDYASLIESLSLEPITSAFHDDDSMRELIIDFVSTLASHLDGIRIAFKEQNSADLERGARTIRGSASGYGFDPIAESAKQIEQAVSSGADADMLQIYLDELGKRCAQVRAPKPRSEAA